MSAAFLALGGAFAGLYRYPESAGYSCSLEGYDPKNTPLTRYLARKLAKHRGSAEHSNEQKEPQE